MNDTCSSWLKKNQLSSLEGDCIITLMLKILDGKCKMPSEEKEVIAQLYDKIDFSAESMFDDDVHQLIASARMGRAEVLREKIYELRLIGETMIARPRMKAFKARMRETGLLPNINPLIKRE